MASEDVSASGSLASPAPAEPATGPVAATKTPRFTALFDRRLLLEAFVLVNLAFLSLDIYLAHSVNEFRHPAEWVPFYFSLAAPPVLLLGWLLRRLWGYEAVWCDLGYLVGWASVVIGLVGTILHLDSRFFHEQTLRSLVYAAPFAAPLAYTGLGLLLVLNRMVEPDSEEWARWVVLLALGGWVGNFVFSLADHAQNGFFHATEWIPVVSSALAVGFLTAPFLTPVTRKYLRLCGLVLGLQVIVGLLGFYFHLAADLRGPSASWWDNLVHGTPVMAPLLFPNLVLLAGLGLWALSEYVPAEVGAEAPAG